MNPSAHSSDQNENDERLDPYQQKWKSIFDEDFVVAEELDYEYSEHDYQIADDFPLSYTWSPASSRSSSNCSSRSSSRASSPVGGIINLLHDEEDGPVAQRHSLKKLTREFHQLYAVNQHQRSSKKNWKNNVDFKGTLKRWRIRSLDTIFTRNNRRYYCPGAPRRVINIQEASGSNAIEERQAVTDVAVVVNNDMYQNDERRAITPEMPRLSPPMTIAAGCDSSTPAVNASLQPVRFGNLGQCSGGDPGTCSQSSQNTEVRVVNTSRKVKSDPRKKTVKNPPVQRYEHIPTPVAAATGNQDNTTPHNPVGTGPKETSTSSTTLAVYQPYNPSFPMEPYPAHMPLPFRPPFTPHPSAYVAPTAQRPNQYFNPGSVQNKNNDQYT